MHWLAHLLQHNFCRIWKRGKYGGIRSNPRAQFYEQRRWVPLIHEHGTYMRNIKIFFFLNIFHDFSSFLDTKKGRNEALKQEPKGTVRLKRLYGTVEVSKYAVFLIRPLNIIINFLARRWMLKCYETAY